MKLLIGTGALAVALLLSGCGDKGSGDKGAGKPSAPVAAVAPPAGSDWTQTVAETPEGGFRMGNPNAPVKLVEYASATCPHCAEFSKEGTQPLVDNYVKSGRVSWEFRHYMLFPTDPPVSLLVRCQGPEPFFPLTEQLYADQSAWVAKVQGHAAELQAMANLPPAQQAAGLIKAAGLDQFFRERGIPQAKIDACLSDMSGYQKLQNLTDRANSDGVTGTPTFFINGVKVDNAATWEALEPALKQAVGQ